MVLSTPVSAEGGLVLASYRSHSLVAHRVLVQSDGTIVTVGSAFDGIGFHMMLGRFLSSGSPDGTFGEQGITTFDLPNSDLNETAEDLVQLPDGSFLIAGAGVPFEPGSEVGPGSYSSFLAKISLAGGTVSTSYAAWISSFDLAASEQGFGDDPDEDGLSNLVEYAFALAPDDAASQGTPDFVLDANGQLSTSYRNLRPELSYLVEASDDLEDWEFVSMLSADSGFEVTDSAMVGTDPRRFVRFRIETSSTPTLTRLAAPTPIASNSQEGNGPEGVQDGDLATRWSAEGLGESLTFTFAEPVTVQEIRVAFFLGTERTANFRVEGSVDGGSFVEILGESTSSGLTDNLQTFSISDAPSVSMLRFCGRG